jgi:hypothetical protein
VVLPGEDASAVAAVSRIAEQRRTLRMRQAIAAELLRG